MKKKIIYLLYAVALLSSVSLLFSCSSDHMYWVTFS